MMRSLLNVRPPYPVGEDFIKAQDMELQRQAAEKGIVALSDIEPCRKDRRLRLWQGDITRLQVDAIVNAANSALLGCFVPMHRCIDNAIHSAAGVQLRLACNRLMQAQGHPEPPGRAKITEGYNLPARHVLHTVGPIVRNDEPTLRQEQELANCYSSCLALADAHGLQSIAFCCISTGEFGFPQRRAAEIAVGTVRTYLDMTVKDYLWWFVPSLLFQIWVSIALFVIRLDGAPRLAMWCNIIPAAVNIVLDWLFVFPLGLGVMGAAAATTISLFIGGCISMGYLLFHARHLRPVMPKWSRKSLRLSLRNIGYQCRIGSSALLGESTMAILMFIGNQVFMRYLGDDGVGAFGITCYYTPFVFMVGNAIAQSAQPIISYNFGAGLHNRVAATERIALLTAIACGTVVTLLFTYCPQ